MLALLLCYVGKKEKKNAKPGARFVQQRSKKNSKVAKDGLNELKAREKNDAAKRRIYLIDEKGSVEHRLEFR